MNTHPQSRVLTPLLAPTVAESSSDATSHPDGPGSKQTLALPRISPWMMKAFVWYGRRHLRRHFHSLRISRSGWQPSLQGIPLVVYSSHASWWDPIVGLVLQDELLPKSKVFAPMAAQMVQKYPMFGRMGFFGVEQNSARGAVRFLKVAQAVLQHPDHVLAVTPQGRLADCRERPVSFVGGLGHLAARSPVAAFVPLAVEYVFWEERLPEILLRFGQPTLPAEGSEARRTPEQWTTHFEREMTQVQDALAESVKRRQSDEFRSLLRGQRGASRVYDLYRRARARLRGEPFDPGHGNA